MIKELHSQTSGNATKIMLLGCGELGKEIIIEAQRMGFYTIGVDRYPDAPGHQLAHKAYAGDMKDEKFLRKIVEDEKPHYIVPEIEAINLELLMELEKEGYTVVPNAKATHIAMQRERIRELIRETGVKTSNYKYAANLEEVRQACDDVGYPCWVKAIMDSSGHGSSFVSSGEEVQKAYDRAKNEARGSGDKMIVEEHIDFDTEITMLTVRHYDRAGNIKTSFCRPVGHYQTRGGDYHSSWQPAVISETAEKKAYEAAEKITQALGGAGLFGCELFVKGDEVYGNECSPRPHDTGMVTFVTQQMGYSEAGLHIRAITGLPIPTNERLGHSVVPILKAGATHVLLSPAEGKDAGFSNLYEAMDEEGVSYQIFGKPMAHVDRRMGIVLALDDDVKMAKMKAERVAHKIFMNTATEPEWKGQQDKEKHLC